MEIQDSGIATGIIKILIGLLGPILLERLPHPFNKVFDIALFLLRIYHPINLIFLSLNRLGVL